MFKVASEDNAFNPISVSVILDMWAQIVVYSVNVTATQIAKAPID